MGDNSFQKEQAFPDVRKQTIVMFLQLEPIGQGDTVTWWNDDTAAHTVTSGTPEDGPDGFFDSSLFMAGEGFEVTFDEPGNYEYFCMVHPWMVGAVISLAHLMYQILEILSYKMH